MCFPPLLDTRHAAAPAALLSDCIVPISQPQELTQGLCARLSRRILALSHHFGSCFSYSRLAHLRGHS